MLERARSQHSPESLVVSSGTPEANRQQGFHSLLSLDEAGKVASDVGVGGPSVLELAGVSAK